MYMTTHNGKRKASISTATSVYSALNGWNVTREDMMARKKVFGSRGGSRKGIGPEERGVGEVGWEEMSGGVRRRCLLDRYNAHRASRSSLGAHVSFNAAGGASHAISLVGVSDNKIIWIANALR